MISFADYSKRDALGLAELVRRKEVSALELVEAAIARAEQVDGKINAVVQRGWERARKAAVSVLPEGPFSGVPFLLKDLLATEAGVVTTHGSRFFKDLSIDHDSELVARQRKAGLVFIGKAASSELGIMPVTETALFGPTRNPWDLSRTPGGSSGGSAAAVAAGIVPLAHASDGGGSIRIPASCCGLFGLKPSRGRNPFGPDYGEGWHGIAQEHCVGMSVRDSAALLDATQGPDVGAPYHAPHPARPFLEEVGKDPGKLRIGFSSRSQLGSEVSTHCIEAVQRAARLCESLGHHVEEGGPSVSRGDVIRAYLIICCAEVAAAIHEGGRFTGRRPQPSDFEPSTWFLGQVGRAFSAPELAAAVHLVHATGRSVAAWFASRDVLLTPTLSQPPLKIGALQPKPAERLALRLLRRNAPHVALRFALDQLADRAFEWAAFTPLANLTGQPAMSVPLHWTPDGLPIGVQFMASFAREDLLFRLASQLESAHPWSSRRAPV